MIRRSKKMSDRWAAKLTTATLFACLLADRKARQRDDGRALVRKAI